MIAVKNYELWSCTGSQDLHGGECLAYVAEHSGIIMDSLNKSGILPYEVVLKPTLIADELIHRTSSEANVDKEYAGVIIWMHTFPLARSRILGPQKYRKLLIRFHIQFDQEIPYGSIGMDFMNENQSAYEGREYGHIATHMGIERKVIVGHQRDEGVMSHITAWTRTAVGIMESSHVRAVGFAGSMRNVAITEGDKVETQMKFGWKVDAYLADELAEYVRAVPKGNVTALVGEYYSKYTTLLEGRDPEEFKRHVAIQAQIEASLEKLLLEKDYHAIVTHFGDLREPQRLPGLAIQRLMEKGYGFGAEGDWKTAAMVRLMEIMTQGMKDAKGTSFMEDYTYNLIPDEERILEVRILEMCPIIADGETSVKACPLSMGGREDPAQLVFTSKTGHGIAASLVGLDTRFRLTISGVECKKTEKPMSKLPVTTIFWTPEPNLAAGVESWIPAGGACHTAFFYDLTAERMGNWADAMGIETVYIGKDVTTRGPKNELHQSATAYRQP